MIKTLRKGFKSLKKAVTIKNITAIAGAAYGVPVSSFQNRGGDGGGAVSAPVFGPPQPVFWPQTTPQAQPQASQEQWHKKMPIIMGIFVFALLSVFLLVRRK